MTIAENIARLEKRIQIACDKAGRKRSDITLVAVSKTKPVAMILEAIRAGMTDIGENRVQEAARKKPLVPMPVTWHFIGHLQTNKVKKALDIFSVIQSVDSARLALEIQRRSEQTDKRVKILAEVNTSAEPTKFGTTPEKLTELVKEIIGLDRLELIGLMTIGPGWATRDPEASRPCFQMLARLAEQTRQKFGIPLPNLSMGMSSDFEIGIEQGATIIRVGTAIFGPR
ncbi:YggS family pyridoxal phosphate-dependent enzyme [candidate division WOR-3 bacterium JGI_Cruoil_03_51_56]|uniref:Pyridoxal phosphate homeostasis protein n=1 Tax=candidate division WOR-3 bacterium JGI_Cruoil_03_51_56 TaxID=1973747 RepID=A0A235BUU4_UNCW3|nr:MAG: YggS family pyridoxal phosphate-dependent enzyme [candidate division WOR-3 bacterium JGI_Cruoil_03_51_56]